MSDEHPVNDVRPGKEFRWWFLSAAVLSIVAAICFVSMVVLTNWGGLPVLIGLGALPWVAESFIQFTNWIRRFIWVTAGLITGAFIIWLLSSLGDVSVPLIDSWPSWSRGLIFLLPAFLEFSVALTKRNRPWTWLIVTPALFGLSPYWLTSVAGASEKGMDFIVTHFPSLNGYPSELQAGAAIFGTVLFTRALVGSFIASRKQAVNTAPTSQTSLLANATSGN